MNSYPLISLGDNLKNTELARELDKKADGAIINIVESKVPKILTIKSDFMYLLIDISNEPNFSELDETEYGENVCINGINSKRARIRDGKTGKFISKKKILLEVEDCLSVGMGDSITVQPWSSIFEKDTESDTYGSQTENQLEAFNTVFIDYLAFKYNDINPIDLNQEIVVNDAEQALLDQLIKKAAARLLLKFKQGRFAVHVLLGDDARRAKPDVEHLVYMRKLVIARDWYPDFTYIRQIDAWYKDAISFDLDAALVVEMTNILNEANILQCNIEDIMQAEADELFKENYERLL